MKNEQKPLRVIFFELGKVSMSITNHRTRSRVRASFFCTCIVNPANFFLFCQPFYISRVSLFLFFSLLYSRVAQTLKNVGPLDCKLSLLRRRSISLGGKISVVEFMHLTFSLQTQQTFLWFWLLLLLFFIHFLSLSFFFSVVSSNIFFFVLVEIVSESTETSFARQPHGASISASPSKASGHFAMDKRAGFFGAHSVQASEDRVDGAKTCLVPLKKKPELEGCLQT